MKKILIMAAVILMGTTAISAQDNKGVNFRTATFKELLADATKENKYLFVDFYAVWCGPCKTMSEKVFPQQKMGDYFNKTFVNAKFDAEKGEGAQLAKQYNVKAYPTFIIFDSKGKEIGRVVGSDTPDGFIEKVKNVIKK